MPHRQEPYSIRFRVCAHSVSNQTVTAWLSRLTTRNFISSISRIMRCNNMYLGVLFCPSGLSTSSLTHWRKLTYIYTLEGQSKYLFICCYKRSIFMRLQVMKLSSIIWHQAVSVMKWCTFHGNTVQLKKHFAMTLLRTGTALNFGWQKQF